MKLNWKFVAVATVGAVVGFLLQSPGPVGKMLWPLAEGTPNPEGSNLALLMLMGGIEAVAFGIGVAFLVFGFSWVRRAGHSTAYTAAVFLSLAWLLVNWVPHTSLHMNHGNLLQPSDFTGLVAIEYGFHFTLILAGLVLLHFVVRTLRGASPGPARPAGP